MANKISSATKVVIPCRISFANIFEPKSINGGEALYKDKRLFSSTSKIELFTPTVLAASSFSRRNCCGENFPRDKERSFS